MSNTGARRGRRSSSHQRSVGGGARKPHRRADCASHRRRVRGRYLRSQMGNRNGLRRQLLRRGGRWGRRTTAGRGAVERREVADRLRRPVDPEVDPHPRPSVEQEPRRSGSKDATERTVRQNTRR
eukprot:6212054-Pleurochrysis_carterae.AAC.2